MNLPADTMAGVVILPYVIGVLIADDISQTQREEMERSRRLTALSGRVVNRSTTPIPNAILTVRHSSDLQTPPDRLLPQVMVLPEDGSFWISIPTAQVVYMDVTAPGHHPVRRTFVIWTPENARNLPNHIAHATPLTDYLKSTGFAYVWMAGEYETDLVDGQP